MRPDRVKEIDDLRKQFKHISDGEALLAALEDAGVSQSEMKDYTRTKKKGVDLARGVMRA
jgi:hypothetical protein